MLINLSKPEIRYGNGLFSVDENGNLTKAVFTNAVINNGEYKLNGTFAQINEKTVECRFTEFSYNDAKYSIYAQKDLINNKYFAKISNLQNN